MGCLHGRVALAGSPPGQSSTPPPWHAQSLHDAATDGLTPSWCLCYQVNRNASSFNGKHSGFV